MNLIIRNGNIVTFDSQFQADILVQNGIISRLSENLPSTLKADEEIDAAGLYILPGGIDPHVHMYLPATAGYSADDFYTGSRAALFGGTTTLIDFVTPKRGQSIPEAFHLRKQEAMSALTDYMFHVSPVEFNRNTVKELKQCLDMGIRSFKVYMAYKSSIGMDDNEILKVLKIIGDANGIVLVHCENGDEIEALRNHYFETGKLTPEYHARSRPPETEADAVQKLLDLSKEAKCPVYLVHISSALSLEHINRAKQAGQKVYAETCPQYLLLDESAYTGDFDQTSKFVMSPPLRIKSDQEQLWDALKNNIIQTVGTDHCPFDLNQKRNGKDDFRKIPNGAGGVEHRLALLYTYGVLEKRITIQQFVNLTSTMPARILGLYPRKGSVSVGSDADLVLWNPEARSTINSSTHHQNCDLNIYEGIAVKGRPEYVIKGGEIVIKDNKLLKEPSGRFLASH